MTSVEEKPLTHGAAKMPNIGAPTFTGCGTQQVNHNSGLSAQKTQAKATEGRSSVIYLRPFPGQSLSSSLNTSGSGSLSAVMVPVSSGSATGYSGSLIAGKNIVILPGKGCQNDATGNVDRTSKEAGVVPPGTAISASSMVKTCNKQIDSTLKSNVSLVTSAASVASLPNLETINGILNSEQQSCNDNAVVEIDGEDGTVELDGDDGSESQTSEEMNCDEAENNNTKDTVFLNSVKTDKAAARLQLNAVLESEIENQRAFKALKAPKVVGVTKSLESKSLDWISKPFNRTSVSLASVQRKSLGSSLLNSKMNLSQVVRIQNAKIVEVFERANSMLRPAEQLSRQVVPCYGFLTVNGSKSTSSFYNKRDDPVTVGHIRVAEDIYGQERAPEMIVPPVMESIKMSDVIVDSKADCAILPSQDLDLQGHGDESQTFVYDPLCISADTLVPVAGTLGHTERQNLDDLDIMWMRQLEADGDGPNSGKETGPNRSNATMLRCFLCPYYHTKQTKIAKHWINTHLAQRPYVCPHCDKAFKTSWEVQVHITKLHSDEKLIVAIKNSSHFATSLAYEIIPSDTVECHSMPDNEMEVPAPEGLHSTKHLFMCNKCDYQCSSKIELQFHRRSSHLRYKPYFCMYCTAKKESFVCDFDLKQHIRIHHPERIPAASRTFQDPVLTSLVADINWSSTYEAISLSNQVFYQCRLCAFRSTSSESAWKHVLVIHNWPETVKCPSCATVLELNNCNRESCATSCSQCNSQIALGPGSSLARVHDKGEPVYICTVCDYKTTGKGSMNRHLKYNHTKCRPYGCVYCNYVAVERPKVKMHIESLHKGKKIAIKERTESNEQFRRVVEDLFSSFVQVSYMTDVSNAQSSVGGDDQHTVDKSYADESNMGSRPPRKRARLSLLPGSNSGFGSDRSLITGLTETPREGERKTFTGEHFKCLLCGYKCIDRSCMSRHVKYMHIPSRPHWCPYCHYNNVEKTKVRLHVKSHHPNQPKIVRTDKKLLEQMSYEAKMFYVRVDSKGRIMQDSSSSFVMSPSSPSFGLSVDSQEGCSRIPDDFILAELDPETDIVDVQTVQEAATVVLKNGGVFEVGIKEEPVDDVEIKQELGIHLSRPADLITSTSALDHNYVVDMPASSLVVPTDLPVTIKTEPEDAGYEMNAEKPTRTESINSSSDLETTDDDDDDEEDGEEEECFVDIPLGASAANLDGLESLDSDDDLDSDSDLLDFADINLDDSDDLFSSEAVGSRWKLAEKQVERDRLQLLSQMKMDDEIRDDPKIWMQTVVTLEDFVSTISSNKPIMDL